MANARLIIRIAGESGEQVHELTDDVTTIGRSSDNTLQIKDVKSSRFQCRLEQRDDGRFRVIDLDSANGTSVNGVNISEQTLNVGDKIVIGNITMVFDQDGSSAELAISDLPIADLDQEKPRYVLEVIEGPQRGEVINLGSEPVTIGRSPKNVFPIDDEAASAYHAEVRRDPLGYFISDLGSTNGTRVNEEKIVKQHLAVGAVVRIGSTKFGFKNIGASQPDDDLFGTIVLDEDGDAVSFDAPPRQTVVRAFALAVGALAAVGALVLIVTSAAGVFKDDAVPRAKNLLSNGSFEGEIDSNGNPNGWSRTGALALAHWSVSRDDDADPDKDAKAALILSRGGDDPYLASACEYVTELPIEQRAYRLAARIKGPNANGEYGLRVVWHGAKDQRETERLVLSGSQPEWKTVERVVVPPAWATTARVACVSNGRLGQIYWDDVVFHVAPAGKKGIDPRRLTPRNVGELSYAFQHTGVLSVQHQTREAIRDVALYIQSGPDAHTDQILAQRESDQPPRRQGDTDTFVGTVRDFASDMRLQYRQTVTAGRGSVQVRYDVRARDGDIRAQEVGVRFTVLDAFAEAPQINIDVAGAPETRSEGEFTAVREIVFSRQGGPERVVVFLGAKGADVSITTRGRQKDVRVRFLQDPLLDERPQVFALTFAHSSRLRRQEIDRLLRELDSKREPREQLNLGQKIIRDYGEEFPEDAKAVREIVGRFEQAARSQLNYLRRRIEDLEVAKGQAQREDLGNDTEKLLADFGRKWSGTEYDQEVAELASHRTRTIETQQQQQQQQANEKKAQLLLDGGKKLMGNDGALPLALSYLTSALEKYPNTPAAQEIKRERLIEECRRRMRGKTAMDAAVQGLLRGLRNYERNREYRKAIEYVKRHEVYVKYGLRSAELRKKLQELEQRAQAAEQ